jgi:hypothetical protein
MSIIQPIYIYKFECLSSRYVRYVLFNSKQYFAQEEVCLLVHNAGIKYDIYVNKEVEKTYDLCQRRMWNKLEDIVHFRTYSVNILDFKSLIVLINKVNRIEKCDDIKQLLQLILAKWDDWY